MQAGRESQLICVADVIDASGVKVTEHQELIEIGDLNAAPKAAVYRLDLWALVESRLLLSRKIGALDGFPEGAIAPAPQIRVFISYRWSRLDAAERLRDVFCSRTFLELLPGFRWVPGSYAARREDLSFYRKRNEPSMHRLSKPTNSGGPMIHGTRPPKAGGGHLRLHLPAPT